MVCHRRGGQQAINLGGVNQRSFGAGCEGVYRRGIIDQAPLAGPDEDHAEVAELGPNRAITPLEVPPLRHRPGKHLVVI
jgi:hypothetical protein